VKHFVGVRPTSILDIGLNYSKIDFIDREFFDSLMDEPYLSEKSRMVIDGIEAFSNHILNSQKGIYKTTHVGNVFEIIDTLETYDMVVVGGILEYLEKKKAINFLDECIAHSDNHLMVCVSLEEKWGQQEINEIPLKKPVSFWRHEDFKRFVYPQKFLQYITEDYGIFLINKEDYIDNKIVELYPLDEDNLSNIGLGLRGKFKLSRENISKIDFSRLAKYIANLEIRNFFLEKKFLEHYRLIACLSTQFNNTNVFDVGTNLGYSALALSYNTNNNIISYDVVECKELDHAEELSNIEYRVGDVLKDERLLGSPLIVLDTNHDGVFENKFYSFLKENAYKGLLYLDDIHLNEPMRDFWNSISEYKEDVTDLGHWAGSGLVEFT
jgi:hypothetical protein